MPVIDVLVIEDDPDTLSLLEELLAMQGYRAEIVANGRDAIAALRGRPTPPSAIILDLMLPDMEGKEFLSLARGSGVLGSIPVIAVSGHDLALTEIAADVYEACLKPVSFHQLFEALGRACNGRPPRRKSSTRFVRR